ncbi:phosphotransferase family protein [Bacillus dakarensis]|uniref:phosphotransferase family protein n=1 Tax=Robertmurraya dakarensis TaxID=1926278 RepID=UPI000980AD2F|nr:phosphotransferase family protein [Bacillus dakarensis]
MSQTIPVRKGEEIDVDVISKYLFSNLNDLPKNTLEIEQFSAGSSNLTYVIKCGEWQGVLRRPPFGPLPPKAHDMEREYEVLRKLSTVFPLVPKPYILCRDKEVIGAPFYIMERVEGVTLEDDPHAENNLTIEDKQHISNLMVDAMVELHNVDYKKAGLENIGYTNGFIERQLKNWVARNHKYKIEDIPEVDNIIKWLESHVPKPQQPTLIHNDFKINNVLFSDDLREVNAILDWEMATIGDPLFDLGTTLSYWFEENDSDLIKGSLRMPTAQPGFISRREFLDKYSKKTGRDVSSFKFYMILSYFKIAVAMLQIYYRYATGQTKDPRFKGAHKSAKNLMIYAESLVHNKDI